MSSLVSLQSSTQSSILEETPTSAGRFPQLALAAPEPRPGMRDRPSGAADRRRAAAACSEAQTGKVHWYDDCVRVSSLRASSLVTLLMISAPNLRRLLGRIQPSGTRMKNLRRLGEYEDMFDVYLHIYIAPNKPVSTACGIHNATIEILAFNVITVNTLLMIFLYLCYFFLIVVMEI